MKKIVLTGGHLPPLLSVIEEISKDFEILVIGRRYTFEGEKVESLEYLTLQKKGIAFENITTGRLQRRFTRFTILSLFKFPYGVIQSFLLLAKFKPDIVLSFGSYVSMPVVLSAFFLRIPIVLHEQTLEAGLANRIASVFAKKVCISWESSRKFFPKEKTVLTGNPIRKWEMGNGKWEMGKNGIPLIYVTGGSSGSHALNLLIEVVLSDLLQKFRIIHQAGGSEKFKDFGNLEKLKRSLPEELQGRYYLTRFVDPSEIGSILSKTDLVVSRSGINTVTELAYFGKPSLLIPLPYSQNNEQMKNAEFLKRLGIGEILNQEKITSRDFFDKITEMIKNIDQYKKRGEEAKKSIKQDAAKKIAEVLKSA